MRKVALLCLICFGMVLFIGCSRDGQAINSYKNQSNILEIKVGVVPLPFYSHIWIAYKNGYLDDELQKVNAKLTWKPISLGPVVSESFAAKEIDMGVMGDFPAFVGKSAGIDFSVVGITSTISKSQALIARKDAGIEIIADLKGKRVATTKNTSGHDLLISLLKTANLSIDDIQFINMSMADLTTAILQGTIDAGVVWEPAITQLEESNQIKVITDGSICPNYAVFMATDKLIKENPQVVQAVNRAFTRGKEYLDNHNEECLKILSAEFKIPERQLQKIIKKYNYNLPIDDTFINNMQTIEQFLEQNKIVKKPVSVQEFIKR